jgi:hypothetical protein
MSIGALIGTLVAGLSFVFASRGELVRVEKQQLEFRGETRLHDFRIRRLEVQMENVAAVTRRTDMNVEKLLSRQNVSPVPAPEIKPLPYMPQIDTMRLGD